MQGSKDHEAVTRLQELLVVQGVAIWRGNEAPGIDGDYGPATAVGVAAFAKDNFIRPVVDIVFWNKLVESMTRAATFVPKSKELGPAIVEVAQAHLAENAREARVMVNGQLLGVDNSGPWARAYLWPYLMSREPWCQGACNEWQKQAMLALGIVEPPFPIDGKDMAPLYVPSVYVSAKKAKCAVACEDKGNIPPGSLMFIRSASGSEASHFHVATVVEDDGNWVSTIEGNTNAGGSSNGWLVCKRSRPRKTGADFGVIK